MARRGGASIAALTLSWGGSALIGGAVAAALCSPLGSLPALPADTATGDCNSGEPTRGHPSAAAHEPDSDAGQAPEPGANPDDEWYYDAAGARVSSPACTTPSTIDSNGPPEATLAWYVEAKSEIAEIEARAAAHPVPRSAQPWARLHEFQTPPDGSGSIVASPVLAQQVQQLPAESAKPNLVRDSAHDATTRAEKQCSVATRTSTDTYNESVRIELRPHSLEVQEQSGSEGDPTHFSAAGTQQGQTDTFDGDESNLGQAGAHPVPLQPDNNPDSAPYSQQHEPAERSKVVYDPPNPFTTIGLRHEPQSLAVIQRHLVAADKSVRLKPHLPSGCKDDLSNPFSTQTAPHRSTSRSENGVAVDAAKKSRPDADVQVRHSDSAKTSCGPTLKTAIEAAATAPLQWGKQLGVAACEGEGERAGNEANVLKPTFLHQQSGLSSATMRQCDHLANDWVCSDDEGDEDENLEEEGVDSAAQRPCLVREEQVDQASVARHQTEMTEEMTAEYQASHSVNLCSECGLTTHSQEPTDVELHTVEQEIARLRLELGLTDAASKSPENWREVA